MGKLMDFHHWLMEGWHASTSSSPSATESLALGFRQATTLPLYRNWFAQNSMRQKFSTTAGNSGLRCSWHWARWGVWDGKEKLHGFVAKWGTGSPGNQHVNLELGFKRWEFNIQHHSTMIVFENGGSTPNLFSPSPWEKEHDHLMNFWVPYRQTTLTSCLSKMTIQARGWNYFSYLHKAAGLWFAQLHSDCREMTVAQLPTNSTTCFMGSPP